MEYITLNDGNQIPALGYGVFEIPAGETCGCVTQALACGYRHIDTAQIYGNESGVGEAIRDSGIDRGEIFLTTKIWVTEYGYDKTSASIDRSLEKLQTDYIDLVLLHRPFFDYKGAWKALERAREEGKIRSVGISNFNKKQTDDLLKVATVCPAVNQIELHPYYAQKKLLPFLAEKNVAVEAWYPLGHGNKKLLEEGVLAEIAGKYGKTPSQIILRWHLQHGYIVFPKTQSPAHMRENMDIFDFLLTETEMNLIDALDRGKPLFPVPDWVQKLNVLFRR